MDAIIGLEVLTSDAKLVGTVEGVGIDTDGWNVVALKLALKKGIEENAGVKKPLIGLARVAVEARNVDSVGDVIKLKRSLDKLREIVIDPSLVPRSAGDIIGKRVICAKGKEVGVTGSLFIDPDGGWRIPYFELEGDKEAFRRMNLKKGMFKGREVKVPTSLVATVGDLIMLNSTEEELARVLQHAPK